MFSTDNKYTINHHFNYYIILLKYIESYLIRDAKAILLFLAYKYWKIENLAIYTV